MKFFAARKLETKSAREAAFRSISGCVLVNLAKMIFPSASEAHFCVISLEMETCTLGYLYTTSLR